MRNEHGHRAAGSVRLRGQDGPQLGTLRRRGPHERDLRIVRVEGAAGEPGRHALALAEVHHVEAARHDDGRHAGSGRGLQPVGTRGQDASDEFIGQFRRRDVEHAGDQAAFDERLHRTAAGAGRRKHEHLVAGPFEHGNRRLDALRGVAEHARHDQRLGVSGGDVGLDHAADAAGRAGEDRPRDAVESLHVDHGGHHHDVPGAHVGCRVPAGQRGHDQFRKTDGQGPHRGRRDRRAASAPQRDHTIDASLRPEPIQQPRRGRGHRRNACSTVTAGDQRRKIDATRLRHRLAGYVGNDHGRIAGPDVDQHHAVAAFADLFGDERMLVALRVERAENGDRGHGITSVARRECS